MWRSSLPARLPQTRPPRDIDFSASLTPWVNMLSLLAHKSYMRVHMHTRIIPTGFKLSTSTMISQTTFISLYFAECIISIYRKLLFF